MVFFLIKINYHGGINMKKYYVLLLNNCFDNHQHYISTKKCSMIPNVLIKEYTNLSTLEEDFLEYDDTIIEGKSSWIIKGSFPVIAEEINGKMYDVITGKEIKYSPNSEKTDTISYKEKYEANLEIAKLSLSILDEESIKRYIKGLKIIEKNTIQPSQEEQYYILTPNKNGSIIPLLTAKKVNSQIIDIVTNEKIYPTGENKITSYLNYTDKIKVERKESTSIPMSSSGRKYYIQSVVKAKRNCINSYNTYINFNKDKEFDDRINISKKQTNKRLIKTIKN